MLGKMIKIAVQFPEGMKWGECAVEAAKIAIKKQANVEFEYQLTCYSVLFNDLLAQVKKNRG